MSIALGSIYGDIRLKLDALKADGEKALGVFSGLRTKLDELGTASTETGTKLNEAGVKAEEAATKVGHVGEKAKESGLHIGEMGKHLLEFTGAMIGMNLVFGVFDKLAETIHGVFERASELQVAEQEMNTLLETTHGKAGMTAKALDDLSTSLSNTTAFTKDAVMHTQNLLLTFTNIGQKVFPDATQAALNMATVLHTDTKSAAILLGKALNDPIKGVTALTRVGVSLSAQQKEAIKHYMALGDIQSAQKVILGELHTEFGKQAQDYGKTLPGALAILQNNVNNATDDISKQLMPALTDLVTKVTPVVTAFMQRIPDALHTAGQLFLDTRDKIEAVANFIGSHQAVFDGLKVVILTIGGSLIWFALSAIPPMIAALGTAIGEMTLFDAAASPIVVPTLAVAAAIALLVIGFKELYDHTPVVRQLVAALGGALQQVGGIIKTMVMPLLDQLGTTFREQLVPAWKSLEPVLKQLLPALQAVGVFLGGVLVVDIGILVGLLTGAFMGLVGLLTGVIRIIGGIVQVFSGVITVIVGLFTGIVNIIKDIVTGNFAQLGPDILQMLQALGSGVVQILSGLWNIIAGIFQGAIGLVWGLISGFVQGIIGFFGTLFDKLVGHSIIPDMITGIIGWFLKLPLEVLKAIGDLELQLLGAMKDLAGKMLQWAADMIGNFVKGIKDHIPDVLGAIGGIASGIGNLLHHSKPEKGPLADDDKWMPDMMNTLVRGIDAGAPKVGAAAGRAALAVKTGLFGDRTGLGLGLDGTSLSGASLGTALAGAAAGPTIHIHQMPITIEVSADEADGDPKTAGQALGQSFGHTVSTVLGGILNQRGY